jgi:type I restriction-modification system DNA methylase subunit
MANVRSLLERIWSRLRQASVVNELDIIEYIAALLVEDIIWPFEYELRPQKIKNHYNPDDISLKNLLQIAAKDIDTQNPQRGLATLFDRYILFYSSRPVEEGSYPTPRYLVDFMIDLLQIRPEHSLADFACGSGSLLIRRKNSKLKTVPEAQTIGIERSQSWARIAATNLALHNATYGEANIYLEDAFHLLKGNLHNRSFDRIAISPPLNISVNESETSDLLFTEHLSARLNPGGKGVIIVSEHIVENTQPTRAQLVRVALVEDEKIQAVIALPNDALRPFLSEPTYLLLIEKTKQSPRSNHSVWFVRADRDGYNQGANRDLTISPDETPENSDLPFILSFLTIKLTTNSSKWKKNSLLSHYRISLKGKFLGIVLRFHTDVRVTWIHNTDQYFLEIEANEMNDRTTQQQSTRILMVERDAYPTTDKPSKHILLEHGRPNQMVAITYDGRCIGITQKPDHIRKNDYSLHPGRYLPQQQPVKQSPPLEHIIATSGTEKGDDIELELFIPTENTSEPISKGVSRRETTKQEVLPPPYELPKPHIPTTFPLLTLLNEKQKTVWQAIEALDSDGRYTLYFTEERLTGDFEQSSIRQTLYFLECLGLIRRVTFPHSKGVQVTYRRTTIQETKNNVLPSAQTVEKEGKR